MSDVLIRMEVLEVASGDRTDLDLDLLHIFKSVVETYTYSTGSCFWFFWLYIQGFEVAWSIHAEDDVESKYVVSVVVLYS